MNKIRVLIFSEQEIIRQSFEKILSGHHDKVEIDIVGKCKTSLSCVNETKLKNPDVVLIDNVMAQRDFARLIKSVKEAGPEIGVIVFAGSENLEDLISSLRAGARGYITIWADVADVITAIRRVKEGELLICRQMAGKLHHWLSKQEVPQVQQILGSDLRKREKEVLKWLMQGLTNKEIANKLCVSERTVKVYVSSILDKLHVKNRSEATTRAIERGLVEL